MANGTIDNDLPSMPNTKGHGGLEACLVEGLDRAPDRFHDVARQPNVAWVDLPLTASGHLIGGKYTNTTDAAKCHDRHRINAVSRPAT